MPFHKYLLFFSFLFLACKESGNAKLPNEFTAKVISVKDGDTIEILLDGKPLRIRLDHIDCPEIKKGQPFAKAAKQFTADLCFGQNVKVINNNEFDRYKRLIAVIINEANENVNKKLVMAGLAWHFKRYSSNQEYAGLEITAKQNRVGLWAESNPIAPWNWRKP